jgi:hypothetical protein
MLRSALATLRDTTDKRTSSEFEAVCLRIYSTIGFLNIGLGVCSKASLIMFVTKSNFRAASACLQPKRASEHDHRLCVRVTSFLPAQNKA